MATTPPLDPKLPLILSFLGSILPPADSPKPFFLALSGIQGSGKSTLASLLVSALAQQGRRAVCLSLDDFYHTATTLSAIASSHPGNKLLRQRGQPGTHDLTLANEVLERLRAREEEVRLPRYDKSARGGSGDRGAWRVVKRSVDVVVLEGWCVGFQALPAEEIRNVVLAASREERPRDGKPLVGRGVLMEHGVEDLLHVNACLGEYGGGFMDMGKFDAVVHLDADELESVYAWRKEQEHGLRKATGSGMSDQEVEAFGELIPPGLLVCVPALILVGIVLRYMPAYVLYLEGFRKGVMPKGRQLRITMGREREIVDTCVI